MQIRSRDIWHCQRSLLPYPHPWNTCLAMNTSLYTADSRSKQCYMHTWCVQFQVRCITCGCLIALWATLSTAVQYSPLLDPAEMRWPNGMNLFIWAWMLGGAPQGLMCTVNFVCYRQASSCRRSTCCCFCDTGSSVPLCINPIGSSSGTPIDASAGS